VFAKVLPNHDNSSIPACCRQARATTQGQSVTRGPGKALLKNRHMQYNESHTYSAVLKQINYTSVNMKQVQNALIQDYIAEDAFQLAIDLIRYTEKYYDKQTLFSYYLAEEMLDSALVVYNELEENHQVDTDWLFVQEMLLTFKIDNLSIFSMDSTKHAALITIAEKNQGSLATANARAILKLVFNEEYWDDLESIGSSRFMHQQASQTKPSKQGKDEFLIIKPNPASSYVEIEFGFTVSEKKSVKVEIHNSTGLKLFDMNVDIGNQLVKINTDAFAEGIYFIRVYHDTFSINKKFLIIR
jgi:hypothetical protein